MSQIKDLTTTIGKLENPAKKYLKKVPGFRAFLLKDIDSQGVDHSESILKLPLRNFRISTFVLPEHIEYVNYGIDNTKKIVLPKVYEPRIEEGINAFLIHSISDKPIDFHICVKPTFSPHGCAGQLAASVNTQYKPLNLFYIKEKEMFLGFDNESKPIVKKGNYYLIPMFMSNATTFYYILEEAKTNKIQEFYDDVLKSRVYQKDHWVTNSLIAYNENLDIFTCSDIQYQEVRP